jgi:hypothetical protein
MENRGLGEIISLVPDEQEFIAIAFYLEAIQIET